MSRSTSFSAVLAISALASFGFCEEPAYPNIGHTRHHHRYQDALPSVPAGPARFTTTRDGAAALRLPVAEDSFRFVVFGDRTGGPPEGVGVLADAVRDANLLSPDLVMMVGDMVQGYNSADKWVPQADEFKSVMKHLACPWFPVAGNHDVYWRDPEGAKRPEGENESLFEKHFGPLWYAFEHRRCWFVVLFGDEGTNPDGSKDFKNQQAQKMSASQFDWLKSTLAKAKSADHVFIFIHHPRWLRTIEHGGYGDDWDRVHALLKANGNVRAVFGGHIHQMRSDGPRDGIEYITLATTGGHVPGYGEALGFLHHFDVVTVRKDGISLAAIPVGKTLDPREMSGTLIAETARFGEQKIVPAPDLPVRADGSATGKVLTKIANPTSRPVEYTLAAGSEDSRWSFDPDHRTGVLAPGAATSLEFQVARLASPIDESFRDPVLTLDAGYLAPGYRYAIPTRPIAIPVALDPAARASIPNRALRFDGKDDFVRVPSKSFDPGETFTLECRFKADSFGKRTGLVTKAQGSDYGIFVNGGRPTFSVFIGDDYLSVRPGKPILETGRWHHLAGVYDGKEARLYLDGKLVASAARQGLRKRNDLPLVIGGDVDGAGTATSHFAGQIDYVRVSTVARYQGSGAEAPARPASDPETCLLLNLDQITGLRLLDESPSRAHAERCSNPALVPVN
ncbi:MAG: metallophosphoesterase [Verrucomicrobia bacterium]|nr:metallophosphoesterase [Verrucomicrobiota bacterium]